MVEVINGLTDTAHILDTNYGKAERMHSELLDLRQAQFYSGAMLALGNGIASFINSNSQKTKFLADALNAEMRSATSLLNAGSARQQMYNARYMGEWQAMQRGLADAQVTSQLRASASASGVRMDEGSKAEVINSQKQAAKLNQIAIQQSTTNKAMQAYLSEAQARSNAIIEAGNAEASRIIASKQNPWFNGLTSFLGSAVQLGVGYYAENQALQIQASTLAQGVV